MNLFLLIFVPYSCVLLWFPTHQLEQTTSSWRRSATRTSETISTPPSSSSSSRNKRQPDLDGPSHPDQNRSAQLYFWAAHLSIVCYCSRIIVGPLYLYLVACTFDLCVRRWIVCRLILIADQLEGSIDVIVYLFDSNVFYLLFVSKLSNKAINLKT